MGLLPAHMSCGDDAIGNYMDPAAVPYGSTTVEKRKHYKYKLNSKEII